MQYGRDKIQGKALSILHLDNISSADVLEKLAHLPHVNCVRIIQL